ncbi:anaphase-promoting complex subunit Cdc23p [Trichomonascus vanleenenianus]|uniref:anaphase promoting complex subunit CDC23 n=1 Tax=Trichomonascus vanleenenianus TaxID=2268995 RepID=UPI003ECA0521
MRRSESSDLKRFQAELLAASHKLTNRCLYHAAKWCAEAANGVHDPDHGDDHEGDSDKEEYDIVAPGLSFKIEDVPRYLQPDRLKRKVLLAKTYFDCREYDRCNNLLEKSRGPLATFLRLYARYISGEKKKEEEHEGILSPKDTISPNKEIAYIVRELDGRPEEEREDPFLLYLYGVALLQQKNEKEALKKLIQSVTLFPYNWSAWQELLQCLPTVDSLKSIIHRLPEHIMTRIFLVHANQEFYQYDRSILQSLDSVSEILPRFTFLKVQRALICYHGLNYPESEQLFDEVIESDPHRLEDMDIYSNILYVMERRPKLAHLAQLATGTDKFRPETCCIVANYYSLRSEHEKAITYYQRALILDRKYLSAWTLMGHEFVELKNTHAAIESYRRAVDANKRDYRAWYGLGQAYEVLEMHYYSLYYYQRATSLKPHDVRMWQALAHCFDKLDRIDEAIKAYKRALRVSDMDPAVLLKIAVLYERINDKESAAMYMKQCLVEEANDGVTDDTCKARLWLAKYEIVRGNWAKAHEYAESVTRGSANDIDEARAIVRETKSRLKNLK